MIKINGYTVEELSNFYKIPKGTIYHWHQHDPENTFKRIINRKIADNKKLKVQRISKIKKQVLISNVQREIQKKQRIKTRLVLLTSLVAILSIYLVWVAL